MKIQGSVFNFNSDLCPVSFQVRFDSVGGLSSHIAALKEMVVFPLLYPEVFEKFKIQPPRYLNMLSLVAVVCAVLL